MTIREIAELTGLHISTVQRRVKDYEAGLKDCDEVFSPIHLPKKKPKKRAPKWGKLKNRERKENLEGIPEGTRHDREVAGQFNGECLPGLVNDNSHRRY